jgi:hypothetical protein
LCSLNAIFFLISVVDFFANCKLRLHQLICLLFAIANFKIFGQLFISLCITLVFLFWILNQVALLSRLLTLEFCFIFTSLLRDSTLLELGISPCVPSSVALITLFLFLLLTALLMLYPVLPNDFLITGKALEEFSFLPRSNVSEAGF